MFCRLLFIEILRVSSSLRSGRVRHGRRVEALDLPLRLRDRALLVRVAEREAFGVDELDVADAQEAEELADVGRLGVAGAGVDAAARRDDIGLLAREQAHRALVRVLEGDAG